MSTENKGGASTIRKVVVVLESISDILYPIEVAADLAARLGAELQGIFIEDLNLLMVADFPFTRQVALAPHPLQPLERSEVESEFRALALRMRKNMERIAAQRKLLCSFKIVRCVSHSYAPSMAEDELLIIETKSRSFGGHSFSSLGSRKNAPLSRAGITAILGHPPLGAYRILAFLVGKVAENPILAERILKTAIDLTQGNLKSLTIFYGAHEIEPLLAHYASQYRNGFVAHYLDSMDARHLRQILHQEKAALALLPQDLAQSEEVTRQGLLRDPPCTLILIG